MSNELFIGIISGTSVDATDAALVDFAGESPRIVATQSLPTPDALRARLERLVGNPRSPAINAWRADVDVAEAFAVTINTLLDAAGVTAREVVAIGSHGQTVWHEPGGAPAFTVQLGDPSRIAARTGITTVADFRRRDMAEGGEGAPFAPALHAELFTHASERRGVLNLGGIANLTVLARRDEANAGGVNQDAVLGFDTGPANTLLDGFAQRALGAPFDRDGALAARGSVDTALLHSLGSDPYFARPPPKSTGRELFNMAWLDRHPHGGLATEDVMRTLTELTAVTIADAVQRYGGGIDAVYACGGGARNPTLMRALATAMAPVRLDSTQALGLHPAWVEAVTFAWLARRTLRGETGNLPSVTGASRAVVLGGVYPASQ